MLHLCNIIYKPLTSVVKRRKQNHKISFHFFAAPPCTPRLLNGLVRKFLVLYASGASARRAQVGVTTLSERKTKFRITTRSARALVIKILRILIIKNSNFVQETPPFSFIERMADSLTKLRGARLSIKRAMIKESQNFSLLRCVHARRQAPIVSSPR